MEFPDGTTPVASHVYIFQGSQDWRSAVVPNLTKVLAEAAEAGSTWEVRQEAEAVIAEVGMSFCPIIVPVSLISSSRIKRVLFCQIAHSQPKALQSSSPRFPN